jgi:hypothetical protein
MTPAEALRELLERVGANNGAPVLVSEAELNAWPETAIRAMKKEELLTPASPASSIVCPGCEQECTMPVHTRVAEPGKAEAFIVCDKRDDISRVALPEVNLRQWSASPTDLARLAARLLGTTSTDTVTGQRSEIGVLRGRKHSSHVVLVADKGLWLHLAGHAVVLANYLTLEGKSFRLDKQAILRLVDKPIAGAGDQESARQRRERLTKLVRAEKAKSNKAFLKTVAQSEGISISRLKQLLVEKPKGLNDARHSRY